MTLTNWNYEPVRTFQASQNTRRYERTVRVFADNLHTEEEVITYLKNAGLFLGATLPENANAYITDISGSCIAEQDRAWEVRLTYSTNDQTDDNPLLAPPEIELDVQSYTQVVERTVDGDAITNSAGEPFDEPPEAEFNRPTLRYTRNETWSGYINGGRYLTYQDVVNSDPFLFAGPGEAKMASVKGRQFVYNGSKYAAVTYEIHFKRGGWKVKPLDQGYSIKQSGFTKKTNGRWARATQLIPITNADGTKPDKPVLLDGNGQKLADNASPVFLEFDVYEQRSFAALGLQIF